MKKQRGTLSKTYILVIVMTLAFLAFIAGLLMVEAYRNRTQVAKRLETVCEFKIKVKGKKKELTTWYDKTNKCLYLFVPAYLKPKDIKIHMDDDQSMYLDDLEFTSGDTLKKAEPGKEYTLTFDHSNFKAKFQLVQNGGVATMYLDTESGSMEWLQESKDNEESGKMTLYTKDGKLDYSGDIDRIKGHGNTSWKTTDKKPLSLKMSKKSNLLGMGKAKKWVLINNCNEVTNMNNKLIYDFGDEIGLKYSPDSQLVDVYQNGEYFGMYLLSEKLETEKNRVDIDVDGEDTDSGYLLSKELRSRMERNGDTFVTTEDGYNFEVVDPDDPSQELQDKIQSDMQSLENALHAEDGIDPDTGKSWDEMIDLDSWAKKYMIEEIFENVDGVRISQYFYKEDGNDVLYAGPVWDYNGTFGNTHTENPVQTTDCLMANREWLQYQNDHNWFYYLYNQDKFYDRMTEIYEETVEPGLEKMLNETMPEMYEEIKPSSEANFLRWRQHVEGYTTVEDEYNARTGFLKKRIAFLNRAWIDKENICYIYTISRKSAKYRMFAVDYGDTFDESLLPDMEGKKDGSKKFAGWYNEKTGELYDFSQPVTEHYLSLIGKWE